MTIIPVASISKEHLVLKAVVLLYKEIGVSFEKGKTYRIELKLKPYSKEVNNYITYDKPNKLFPKIYLESFYFLSTNKGSDISTYEHFGIQYSKNIKLLKVFYKNTLPNFEISKSYKRNVEALLNLYLYLANKLEKEGKSNYVTKYKEMDNKIYLGLVKHLMNLCNFKRLIDFKKPKEDCKYIVTHFSNLLSLNGTFEKEIKVSKKASTSEEFKVMGIYTGKIFNPYEKLELVYGLLGNYLNRTYIEKMILKYPILIANKMVKTSVSSLPEFIKKEIIGNIERLGKAKFGTWIPYEFDIIFLVEYPSKRGFNLTYKFYNTRSKEVTAKIIKNTEGKRFIVFYFDGIFTGFSSSFIKTIKLVLEKWFKGLKVKKLHFYEKTLNKYMGSVEFDGDTLKGAKNLQLWKANGYKVVMEPKNSIIKNIDIQKVEGYKMIRIEY